MMGAEMIPETSIIFNQLICALNCAMLKTVFMMKPLEYVQRLLVREDKFCRMDASDVTSCILWRLD
jgi:hypothetical protein